MQTPGALCCTLYQQRLTEHKVRRVGAVFCQTKLCDETGAFLAENPAAVAGAAQVVWLDDAVLHHLREDEAQLAADHAHLQDERVAAEAAQEALHAAVRGTLAGQARGRLS